MKDFFLNPTLDIVKNSNLKSKITELVLCILCFYACAFISQLILAFVQEFILNLSVTDLIIKQQNKKLFSGNFYYDVFLIILIVPVLEEIIFRLPLNLKSCNVAISLATLTLITVGDKLSEISIYSANTWFKILSVFVVFTTTLLIKRNFFAYIRMRLYGLYFYTISIAFGLLHITNFIELLPKNLVYIAPFFVLPQIFLGLFVGYLRLKNGFIWGLFMHGFFNLPTVLIYILK